MSSTQGKGKRSLEECLLPPEMVDQNYSFEAADTTADEQQQPEFPGDAPSLPSSSSSLLSKHPPEQQQQRVVHKASGSSNSFNTTDNISAGSSSGSDDGSDSSAAGTCCSDDDDFSNYGSTSSSSSSSSSSSNNSVSLLSGNVFDKDVMAAAAMIAHRQWNNRQPLLLGSNADGTINVQLPTGTVIVVEATAFPEYKKTFEKSSALAQRTSVIHASASVPQGEQTGTTRQTAARAIPATTTAEAPPLPPPHAILPQQRATNKATVEQIEAALPSAASCVFHIFDRRVNLDAHHNNNNNSNGDSSTTATTYSLLRAWAQDDPYRYRGPAVDPPTTLSTMRCCSAGAAVGETVGMAARGGVAVVHPTAEALPDNHGDTRPVEIVDILVQLQDIHARPVSDYPVDERWDALVQQARKIRKRKAKGFRSRDAQAIRSLKERGIELN